MILHTPCLLIHICVLEGLSQLVGKFRPLFHMLSISQPYNCSLLSNFLRLNGLASHAYFLCSELRVCHNALFPKQEKGEPEILFPPKEDSEFRNLIEHCRTLTPPSAKVEEIWVEILSFKPVQSCLRFSQYL